MFTDVAVCLPLYRTFVYKLKDPVDVGCRVVVPFGKRDVDGFVVGFREEVPAGIHTHDIESVIDPKPLVRPDVFELCRWVAEYYLAPLGEVLKSALPPGISAKHVLQTRGSQESGVRSQEDVRSPGFSSLTNDQLTALSVIPNTPGFQTILLHGVTGSGKTEVYLRAAERVMCQGRTALILVPEIGLTPQLTERFTGRFPGLAAILHSSLSKRQRIDEWLRVYSGNAPIVIGTRSAVFAPLQNLGLIVVDEEHETSYKQEELPRYHARDTAVMRGKLTQCVVVLGSATPSMESFRNADAKKYTYVPMSTRVEDRPLPEVEIVNMRDEYNRQGKQVIFSRRLLQAIGERLERREQVMILLNRRGFAAFLLCRHCGFTFQCTACSVAMTYHKKIDKLLCHYCGRAKKPPAHCSQCESEYIYYIGEGTERIEVELQAVFPDAKLGRIDRDTMRHVRDFERVLGGFRKGDIDLLVGTQMIAKGHDFPRVTLVGVVGAAPALSLPDFRAAERTFQLLTQVAGRSGRGNQPGEVVIQSYFPDHYTFQLACTQRFEDFYSRESRYRKAMFYPPFTCLAGITVSGRDAAQAARLARIVSDLVDSVRTDSIRVLGPAPAALEKLKNVFRQQLLIKSSSRSALHHALGELERHLEEQKIGPGRVTIDVDPVSMW
jgi:primosomal protein N' (replication factor Y)